MYTLTFEELLQLIKIALAMKNNSTDDDTYIVNQVGFDMFCDTILTILERHNRETDKSNK